MSVEAVFTITVTDTTSGRPRRQVREHARGHTGDGHAVGNGSRGRRRDQLPTSRASHGTVGAVGPITCAGTPKVCTADVLTRRAPTSMARTASRTRPATACKTRLPRPSRSRSIRSTTRRRRSREPHDGRGHAADAEPGRPGQRRGDRRREPHVRDRRPAHARHRHRHRLHPRRGLQRDRQPDLRVTDRGDPDNCGAPGAGCDGPETSTTETVSITVDPVNDTPIANPGNRTTAEDTPLTLDLAELVSDVETADANLTYEIVTQPTHGTARPPRPTRPTTTSTGPTA